MICRLCTWFCDRFCPPQASSKAIWRASHDWDESYAADWEPAEGDEIRERWALAKSLLDEDPAAALAIYHELAERGSPFAMLWAGFLHETGRGTKPDAAAAEEFYRGALCAGSWKATLGYARMLFKRGAHDKWPSTLQDGVDNGFIPAFFWLAWYQYERSPTSRTARQMRRVLEAADRAGHPGAELLLARWTAAGKFGLREIPRGLRMLRAIFRARSQPETTDLGLVPPPTTTGEPRTTAGAASS
jgi:hypothetical protein